MTPESLKLNISLTARDTGLVQINNLQQTVGLHCELNGHVTDDVTLPKRHGFGGALKMTDMKMQDMKLAQKRQTLEAE